MTVPSPGQPGYILLADAEAILLPHIPLLIDVAKQSLALFLADPVVVRQASNLGRSVFLWDNFFPFAETAFATVPGVSYEEADGRRFLRVDSQIILGFNKVDSHYESCTSLNPSTERADAWHSQLHLQDAHDVNLPRLELGYMLDATATQFDRLCIMLRGKPVRGARQRGSTVQWLWLLGGRQETRFPLVFNNGLNIFGEQVYSYSNFPV